MTKKIITKKFNVSTAEHLVDNISQQGDYFIFTAKHTPYDISDLVIPTPSDSDKTGIIGVYNDMLFGKRVQKDDVVLVAPRYDWTANTVYDMYDDIDSNLHSKEFYTSVNAGSYTHIYKCLYNNFNAKSMVEPSGTDENPFETPSDGYVWKYICSANNFIMNKFATTSYIPIISNNEITSNAIPGTIDIIKIENTGSGYNNYIIDSFGSSADIKINGNPYMYGLGPDASLIDGFYNNCLIKITSGAAKDEYKLITDYYISNGKKIIVLDDVFTGQILPTDTYEIYPYVTIYDIGNSKQTNCVARAIVSPTSGNSISKIDIISPGSYYRSASANINYSTVVPVMVNSELRPIISPPGGHGADSPCELKANHVAISVSFAGDEVPFRAENDYRTYGLVKELLFSNVNILTNSSNTLGQFSIGEKVYNYKPIKLAGSVTVQTSNSIVTGVNTTFFQALSVNDGVIITDGISNFISNIEAISSNTSLTLSSNVNISSNTASIYLVKNPKILGYTETVGLGNILLSNVSPISDLLESPYIYGETSQCTSMIDITASANTIITVNGRDVNSFNKFNQMSKFVGTIVSGNFIEDETVVQGNESPVRPSAKIFTVVDANSGPNDTMFVTNISNKFLSVNEGSDGIILGSTSNAAFIISDKYNGEIVPDSGEIIYIENISPVTRTETKTEKIILIVEFL